MVTTDLEMSIVMCDEIMRLAYLHRAGILCLCFR